MPAAFMIFSGQPKQLGGCEIYRGTMPLTYLGQINGWTTGWAFYTDLLEEYKKHGKSFWADFFYKNDVFIFPRMVLMPNAPTEVKMQIDALFTAIRKSKKAVVYEVDDDFTNLHRRVTDGSAIDVASKCSAISVTTPYLSRLMIKHTKRPCYILPNYVEGRLWHKPPEKRFYDTMLTIGLTGSPSHEKDWDVVAPAMHRLSRKYPNVKFVIGGYFPEYLSGIDSAEYIPGLPYDQYAELIKQCDVILAPVNPNDPFNMGKSPIKAVEGMSAARTLPSGEVAGAAVIATRNPVYELAIQHEKTGLLVDHHTPEAWEAALERIISDDGLRKHLQIKALARSKSHWTIESNAHRWGSAYLKVLKRG